MSRKKVVCMLKEWLVTESFNIFNFLNFWFIKEGGTWQEIEISEENGGHYGVVFSYVIVFSCLSVDVA
jgi:hypothetical protein